MVKKTDNFFFKKRETNVYIREGGFDDKKKDYLPTDKQFLVTRNGKKKI